MFENKYPYTDFHELNLDWFMSEFKKLIDKFTTIENAWKEFNDKFGENLAEVTKEELNKMYNDGRLANLIANYMGYVTPQMFGAKADGTNDDTKAINDAINASPDKGGKVYFPLGIYRISDSIKGKSNVDIVGSKGSSIEVFDISEVDDKYWAIDMSGCNNFTISNLKLRKVFGGLLLGNCKGFTIDSVAISTRGYWNIYAYGVDNFRFNNISPFNDIGSSYRNETDGIHIVGPAKNGVINNVIGCCNDDLICLQTDKTQQKSQGLLYPASAGEVTNIIIDGLVSSTAMSEYVQEEFVNSTTSFVLINAKNSRMDNIYVSNIIGKYSGGHIFNITGRYLTEFITNIGTIIVDNVNVKRTRPTKTGYVHYMPFMVECPNAENIIFNNINVEFDIMPATSVFYVGPNKNPTSLHGVLNINNIELNNIKIKSNDITPSSDYTHMHDVIVESSNITNLSISKIDIIGHRHDYIVKTETSANIYKLQISGIESDCDYTGSTQSGVLRNLGSVKSVVIRNSYLVIPYDIGYRIVNDNGTIQNIIINDNFFDFNNNANSEVLYINDGSFESVILSNNIIKGSNYPVYSKACTFNVLQILNNIFKDNTRSVQLDANSMINRLYITGNSTDITGNIILNHSGTNPTAYAICLDKATFTKQTGSNLSSGQIINAGTGIKYSDSNHWYNISMVQE